MSFSESSYQQTSVMRDAVEMVVRLTQEGEHRRDEIARIIFRIVSDRGPNDVRRASARQSHAVGNGGHGTQDRMKGNSRLATALACRSLLSRNIGRHRVMCWEIFFAVWALRRGPP